MAGADGVWRCAASTVVESSMSAAPLQRAVLRASLDRLAEEGVVVAEEGQLVPVLHDLMFILAWAPIIVCESAWHTSRQ